MPDKDTDSFVLTISTNSTIKDLQNLNDLFDFSDLIKNYELYSITNKKVIGKIKIETPKYIFIDEFFCLRSKAYSFKCGSDNENWKVFPNLNRNVLKMEKNNCLFGGEYQKECDNYVIRSINHGMYLQKVRKSTLPPFDEKRRYTNKIENISWN